MHKYQNICSMLIHVVRSCMNADPNKRPTANELLLRLPMSDKVEER